MLKDRFESLWVFCGSVGITLGYFVGGYLFAGALKALSELYINDTSLKTITELSLHAFVQAGAFGQKLPFYIFPYFSSSHTRLLIRQGQSLEPITYIYCRSSIEGVIPTL